MLVPRPARAQIRIEDAGRGASLSIGGWIQPRYEYTDRPGAEDLSSFFLRRVRLDVQGQIGERVSFRVSPDVARTASMRDVYVNVQIHGGTHVRFGQFQVPFQWQRFVGARRQHFVERGAPSMEFGFPTGRDIGIMIFGRTGAGRLDYGVGVFDGAGRNEQQSNSAGNMVSGRLMLAVLGQLERDESDLRRSTHPNLSIGLGVQGATRNEVRAWDLGRSEIGNPRADWSTGTADVALRWQGVSMAVEAFLRRVRPEDTAVAAYSGNGYMVTSGFAFVPNLLEVVARFSELRRDVDDPSTGEREWGLGLNIYHNGHESKTRIQYLNHRVNPLGSVTTGTFIVEYQLQF